MTRASAADAIDLRAIHAALCRDDLEAAIEAGLLAWEGTPMTADVGGCAFDPGTWAWLRAVRTARLDADAARARMHARNARLAGQRHARAQALLARTSDAKHAANVTPDRTTQSTPSPAGTDHAGLPDAARAVLERALARARKPRD
jgi:hypothetical protein